MSEPWLVFLHGINADRQDHLWLEPLDSAMSLSGHRPFARDRVLLPDFREQLRGRDLEGSLPEWPVTWTRPDGPTRRRAVEYYLARAACLDARLRSESDAAVPPVPLPQVDGVPAIPMIVDDARRYARDRNVRDNVQHVVLSSLAQLPPGSSIVIVAHSLGSVVAVDILKKLPAELRVEALVTIGSPLASVGEFRGNHDLKEFPYDRVRAWVNVYEPRDPVTGGRGLARDFPQVLDVPVHLPDWFIPAVTGEHGANFYCIHPAVASAITGALSCGVVATTDPVPELRVAGLELQLLQSLYLRELGRRLPPAKTDRAQAFERARQVIAVRHSDASAMLSQTSPGTSYLPPRAFLVSPDQYLRGLWDDPTLLSLAIMLASGLPAAPFHVETQTDAPERRKALQATLQLVRRTGSALLDEEFVDAILEARATARECFKGHAGVALVRNALVGAGALTLAATGALLVAAIPAAGLAGAALVTSTLAAFGPGGMIGGLATLAGLTGLGTAMTAAGTTLGVTGAQHQAPNFVASALSDVVVSQNPEDLRALLISLLTLVYAQERLEFPSQRSMVHFACGEARARVSVLLLQHDSIDPNSPSAKATKAMAELLELASNCLRDGPGVKGSPEEANPLADLGSAFDQAIKGDPAALEAVLQRGELPSRPSIEP